MWSLLIIVLTSWTGIAPVQPVSVGSVEAVLRSAGLRELPDAQHLADLATLVDVAIERDVMLPLVAVDANDVVDRVALVDDAWGVVGPEWRDISSRFVGPVIACRNEVLQVEASSCVDELEPTLWLAHAERLSATIVMRLSMADALGPIDRQRVTGGLLAERDRTVDRMMALVGDVGDDGVRATDPDRILALELGVVLAGIDGSASGAGE